MAVIFTLLDMKEVLVTRYPTQSNLFTPNFTIVSQGQGWHYRARCSCLWNGEEQSQTLTFLVYLIVYETRYKYLQLF